MGRGVGKTQQRILDYVNSRDYSTVDEIAEAVGASPRQVRTAVHALHKRELVWVQKGWRGTFDPGVWWEYSETEPPEDVVSVPAHKDFPAFGRGKPAPGWGWWIERHHNRPTGAELEVLPGSMVEKMKKREMELRAFAAALKRR